MLAFLELFFLPLDFVTARTLEAVLNKHFDEAGSFYPSVVVRKLEYPANAFYESYANRRATVWYTDRFGYRNRPSVMDNGPIDLVIGGASNVYGSYLDQTEIISEVLSKLCACNVYNFGVALNHKSRMFLDKRFAENPPRVFIAIAPDDQFSKDFDGRWPIIQCKDAGGGRSCQSDGFDSFSIRRPYWAGRYLDQLLKANTLQFLRARLGTANRKGNREKLRHIADLKGVGGYHLQALVSYQREAHARGAEFLFVPLPKMVKRNAALLPEAHREGIETVDIPETFRRRRGVRWKWFWFQQDKHWRPEAVLFVAEKILDKLATLDAYFSANQIAQRREDTRAIAQRPNR
jgi:hypothetical protein